jgi:hypothetical protein
MKYIPGSDTMMTFFLPLLNKEKLASVMADQEAVSKHIINNSDKVPLFQDVCKSIIAANQNQKLVKKIRKALTENQDLANSYTASNGESVSPTAAFYVKKPNEKFGTLLTELKTAPQSTAHQRNNVFERIEKSIPEQMTADEAADHPRSLVQVAGKSVAERGDFGSVGEPHGDRQPLHRRNSSQYRSGLDRNPQPPRHLVP